MKILDFGLAKPVQPEEKGPQTELPTATEPGVVLGTIGYMSPEQVRGQAADVRSDIFSFGAILYEMLSGSRAFSGGSAADTMSAILVKEPPDFSVTDQNITPGLERIVRHCLEKNPEERFHSAHDLAFDLAALSGISAPSGRAAVLAGAPARKRIWLRLAGLAAVAAIAGGAYVAGTRAGARPFPCSSSSPFGGARSTGPDSRQTARRFSIAPHGAATRAGSSPPAWAARISWLFRCPPACPSSV